MSVRGTFVGLPTLQEQRLQATFCLQALVSQQNILSISEEKSVDRSV